MGCCYSSEAEASDQVGFVRPSGGGLSGGLCGSVEALWGLWGAPVWDYGICIGLWGACVGLWGLWGSVGACGGVCVVV